jgi:protein-disulfide isomerase
MQKKIALGLSALVLTAGLGLWATGSKTPGMSTLAPLAAQAQETAPAADATAIEVKDFTIGAVDAKVKIVEYASFTCPHCATFHDQVFKTLKTDYIDTGKVLFEYR